MAERSISRADSVANVQSYRLPNRYRNYIILLVLFFLYMTVCTIFYTYYEEWGPREAMFFVVETMSTVGYGYRTPSDDRSRLFTIFAMIFGVFVVFGGISTALTHRLAAFKTKGKYRDLDRVEEIHKDLYRRLKINIAAIIVALFIAAFIFYFMENWTFIKSLYFAVQTATSVGYGDIELGHHGTHIVVGIYMFLSVILLAFAIANITDIYQERKRLGKMLTVAQRMQTLDKLKELDTGHGVPRDTFVLAVLEQLGVLDRENDILPWIKKFEEFDVDNKGFLQMAELEQFCVNEGYIGAAQAQRIRHLEESHGGLEFGARVADKVRDILAGRLSNRSGLRASEMQTLRSSMPALGRNSMPTLGSQRDVTAGAAVSSPLTTLHTRSTRLMSINNNAADAVSGNGTNGPPQWYGDGATSRSSV